MKSNLDLSEFERCGERFHRPLLRQVKPEVRLKTGSQKNPVPEKLQGTTPMERKSHEVGRYKFIPVGFERKHLELLDDAVFGLKKSGHLKASRSSIIRILIERHTKEVVNDYSNDGL